MKVAYYKGCLASLSAKELDTSTQALAPKLGIELDELESVKEGVDWDLGVKHAKWFIVSTKTTGWLREMELVPKTQGVLSALKETKFALALARRGKIPPPGPIHVAADVDEARNLYDLVKEQGRDGALGIVQGEAALAKIEHIEAERAHEEEESE